MLEFKDGLSGHKSKPISHLQLVRSNNDFDTRNSSKQRHFEKEVTLEEIQEQLTHIKEALDAYIQISGSTNEGGGDMEKIFDKISEIDKKVAVLEEKSKKLDALPTRDEIKNIITDSLNGKDLSTKSEVELQIVNARNTQIIWTVATVLTAVGLIIKFV